MNQMLFSVKVLRRSRIAPLIRERINEFRKVGKKTGSVIFQELCFCILAANYDAQKTIKIEKAIGDGFLSLSKVELRKRLKQLGYRFPNTRADYILEARKHKELIKEKVMTFSDGRKVREWLVENIRGLGYKEASHFLRNIGFNDLAVIDFHIVDLLERYGLIERPKTLTKRRYFEFENALRMMAEELHLTLAELDLYLWYLETGKILK